MSRKGRSVPTIELEVDALPAAPAACKNGIKDIDISILFLKSDYEISLKIITRINLVINGEFVIRLKI